MARQKLSGRLLYMGWLNRPWKLITENGEINLWPLVEGFFISLNGKRAEHKQELNGYILYADDSSEYQFEYVPNDYLWLIKIKGFGLSNTHTYLDESLVWLSGRIVKVEIEDGKHIKFFADKSESVYGVYFTGDGNQCEVPSGVENTVCMAGKGSDCCVFLSVGGNGFCCEKFNGLFARALLYKLAQNTSRAGRIGNCALLGRKK